MIDGLITSMATPTAPAATPAAVPPAQAERSALELSTGAATVGAMILRSGREDGVALRYKVAGAWQEISYPELVRVARDIAKGLIALGINAGDRVSILAETRPEWTLADAGSFCAGTVVAPIYQTNSPEECEYVLRHSEARVVFCEDAAQLAKIAEIRAHCPALEHVVAFAGEGAGSISLDELIDRGREIAERRVDERVAAVAPDDMASLVYTSGTTGPPKACILTHRNFTEAVHTLEERLDLTQMRSSMEFFLFLPLAHVFARITQMFTLDLHGALIYWQRDPTRLLDDIREARPTFFPSVPRVWEKIYTAATSGVAKQPALKRTIFTWGLGVGRRTRELERAGRTPDRFLQMQHRVADRLVLSKVRDLFGGRLELAVTAAAPIADEVVQFFDACGILLVEAWGMTETCAAGAINTEREMKIGTVGRPVSTLEMRIAPDGELLARGPNIFAGYFKDEEATREALPDGWLATGDLASIDDDGFITITGRKKDIIITSSGKNITAANIENALRQTRWISEAVAFGDRRPYLVALLTLDSDEAPKLAEQLGIPYDAATFASDARVRAELQGAVDAVNQRFARIEQIKRFAILDRELSQDDGELTPTLKVKRAIVYDKFAGTFNSLYEG
ncbi:MAG TPA: long-chain fatty acid--CoA ligase [Solirubrobacteraceae bacterium]|nr:long-chain fatty acid--CoA ligase [Solirubrobacteraceae bacterium]